MEMILNENDIVIGASFEKTSTATPAYSKVTGSINLTNNVCLEKL